MEFGRDEFELPVETSFMLALKESRYKALDYIFTKHMRKCMAELATVIKLDRQLNKKWNIYVGLDIYMPTLLVWLLLRERARPDVKKRLKNTTELRGFTSLPHFQFKEILKYI